MQQILTQRLRLYTSLIYTYHQRTMPIYTNCIKSLKPGDGTKHKPAYGR